MKINPENIWDFTEHFCSIMLITVSQWHWFFAFLLIFYSHSHHQSTPFFSGTHSVDQDDLEFTDICLSLPPECWDSGIKGTCHHLQTQSTSFLHLFTCWWLIWISRSFFSDRVLRGRTRLGDEKRKKTGKFGIRRSCTNWCLIQVYYEAQHLMYSLPEEKWDRVSKNCHTMGQSQHEANQAMLHKGNRMSQLSYRPTAQ